MNSRVIFSKKYINEQEELKLAMCRLSEKYQLANVATQLLVPVDIWFEWTEEQRNEYVKKVNAMSVEDMLKGKRVLVKTEDESSTCLNREFQELSFNAAKVLIEKNKKISLLLLSTGLSHFKSTSGNSTEGNTRCTQGRKYL